MRNTLIALTSCVLVTLMAWHNSFAQEAAAQKAVLVTGASTGIGRNITERLASEGYFVYAGARKAADLAELDAIDNVQSVRLDVTVQEEIDAALELVKSGGKGLYGIVNNAGVANIGAMIEIEESEIEFLFDVNVYGPYRVTKTFAPLVIEEKGRIVNISSISGILSGSLFGPYSMSKHAIEAYTDTLAREMADFDVKVSAVEPGNYNSKIGNTLVRRMEELGTSVEDSAYREQMQRAVDRFSQESTDAEPDAVSDAVLDALFSANPKEHYMVVPSRRQAEITIRKSIEELVRYNEGHRFSYSRDELIAMLDDELENN